MRRFLRLLLVPLLLPLSAAWAQTTSPPQLQPRPSNEAPAPGSVGPQISLDVRVTDKSGALVRGLQEGDFVILDDKHPQKIVSFQAAESDAAGPATEIIVVIDTVNASFVAVTRAHDQLKAFLLQNGGKLPQPVSLAIFSDAGLQTQNGATRDGNALAAQFDQQASALRTERRSQGVYGAEDRLNLSLNALIQLVDAEKTKPGRKLMIWISPGWPLLSGPNLIFSPKQEHRLFDSIVGISAQLRQAQVTLYSVDPLGLADAASTQTTYYKEFVKGVSQPTQSLPGYLGLQVLAVQSGGLVLNSSNDLTTAIATCAADAQSFYVLSFNAPPPDKPNQYHTIAVRVEKTGVTARTRNGYYDQMPEQRPSPANFNIPVQ